MLDNDSRSNWKKLTVLQNRLGQVAGAWTGDDYRTFITFYSRLLPQLIQVERCTIFVMERGSNRICSIFGTGLAERQIEPPLDGSLVGQVIKTGKSRIDNNLKAYQGYHSDVDETTGFVSRNMICSPIRSITENRVSGAIQLLNKIGADGFTAADLGQLDEIAHFVSISIESVFLNQEIMTLADRLGKEVARLEGRTVGGTEIIAGSAGMREVLNLVQVVSNTPVNVLIQGENGTGKELVARMIHENGERKNQPFVPVNCACVPENLVESEFFGHEKGAFTGADQARRGLFEEASGGSLFLDEIGEMPLVIQPKFLRAIQEGEGSRLGSNRLVKYDLRLISATNRDLAAEIRHGRFREDLYFRLFSVEILLPPLRDRREDILPLAQHFLDKTNERFAKQVIGFSMEVMEIFDSYPWPGNVRQLQKEVERLVALTANGQVIAPDRCSRDLILFAKTLQLPVQTDDQLDLDLPLRTRKLEVELIRRAMERTGDNRSQAATLLNITRQGLLKKIKRYGLDNQG